MAHPFYRHQKGFTLLELLVVITLLAVLAVGALVAYDGVGENANAVAAANNANTADSSIRIYRSQELEYPSQWDNLYATGTDAIALLDSETQAILSPVAEAGFGTALSAVLDSLHDAGIEEVQNIVANGDLTPGVAPNLMHNEGANPNADEVDVGVGTVVGLAILPDHNGTAVCNVGGGAMPAKYGAVPVAIADGQRLNKINDSLEDDDCDLVVALGFGHDAAHSTSDSKVAIAQAPTYTSKNVNPSTHYARYIGLFHLGTEDATAGDVTAADIKEKARFVGFIDPEGNTADENLKTANSTN